MLPSGQKCDIPHPMFIDQMGYQLIDSLITVRPIVLKIFAVRIDTDHRSLEHLMDMLLKLLFHAGCLDRIRKKDGRVKRIPLDQIVDIRIPDLAFLVVLVFDVHGENTYFKTIGKRLTHHTFYIILLVTLIRLSEQESDLPFYHRRFPVC